jgi:hypothetical protein
VENSSIDPSRSVAVTHELANGTSPADVLAWKAAQARAATPAAGQTSLTADEGQHGKLWWWLHDLGLVLTQHERAELLRKAYGSGSGGVIVDKDGDPVDFDQLSDEEVIALYKELRGRPIGPPLAIAAAAVPLARDGSGKVHGQLPTPKDIQSWKKADLEQSAEELEKSIAARKAEQVRLGEEAVHRARITKEEDLLRAINKRLRGS